MIVYYYGEKVFKHEENIMHETEAKSILSGQNGINIYRGCTHGCIYCDSRSKLSDTS